MTISDFQKVYGAEWNTAIRTPMFQAALQTLHDARMLPTCDGAEHQAVYRLGAIAGYEQAEKNLIILSIPSKVLASGPAQDYGVKEKPESKD